MLRSMKETDSVTDLMLSQIGLFLATGILLTVVFCLLFTNDWQRTVELQSIASGFSNLVTNIDNRFFEHTTRFQFPKKDYAYSVSISTEYIAVSAPGSWDSVLRTTARYLIRPWPRFSEQYWTTGNDLHMYLNETCGHHGTENDAIPIEAFTSLYEELNTTISFFALQPLQILVKEPVFLEKVTIFYDDAKQHDFLVVYQRS